VSTIHQAFMASETHRHIIMDTDFNQVGVGVAKAGSTIYVTQIFARRLSGSSPAPAPKPKAKVPIYHAPAEIPTRVYALTSRIWSIDLTAPPVTVDVLMQLIELDAS
jgi:hypothetical protein